MRRAERRRERESLQCQNVLSLFTCPALFVQRVWSWPSWSVVSMSSSQSLAPRYWIRTGLEVGTTNSPLPSLCVCVCVRACVRAYIYGVYVCFPLEILARNDNACNTGQLGQWPLQCTTSPDERYSRYSDSRFNINSREHFRTKYLAW